MTFERWCSSCKTLYRKGQLYLVNVYFYIGCLSLAPRNHCVDTFMWLAPYRHTSKLSFSMETSPQLCWKADQPTLESYLSRNVWFGQVTHHYLLTRSTVFSLQSLYVDQYEFNDVHRLTHRVHSIMYILCVLSARLQVVITVLLQNLRSLPPGLHQIPTKEVFDSGGMAYLFTCWHLQVEMLTKQDCGPVSLWLQPQ